MSTIEDINLELARIHQILSGEEEIPELPHSNEELDYSGSGKGDDGGIVFVKNINPEKYSSY